MIAVALVVAVGVVLCVAGCAARWGTIVVNQPTVEADSVALGGVVAHHDAISTHIQDFWVEYAERARHNAQRSENDAERAQLAGEDAQLAAEDLLLILIGPDHYDELSTPVAIGGGVPAEFAGLTDKLEELPFVSVGESADAALFQSEHSVTVHDSYIQEHVGDVPVLKVLLRGDSDLPELRQVSELIAAFGAQQRVAVVASVDFSHYQHVDEADIYDDASLEAIQAYDYARLNTFDYEHIDSDQAVIVLLQSVCPQQDCAFDITYEGNSYTEGVTDRYNTTSYIHLFVE